MTTPTPTKLDDVLTLIKHDIAAQFDRLERGEVSVTEWYDTMRDSLAVFHRVAWMEGQNSREVSPTAEARIDSIIANQITYLENFASEIADGLDDESASWATWRARASMYGDAVFATASEGKYQYFDLPAHPGDGKTQCLTRCRCAWEATNVDNEELDGDFYWRLGAAEENCPDCVANATRYNPLRVRGGVAV